MKRYIILLSLFITSSLAGQNFVYQDADITETVRLGLEKTYNFEFDAAEKIYLKVKDKYPTHPAFNFLMAINTYWKLFYNNSFTEQSAIYMAYLEASLQQTEKLAEKFDHNPELIFFYLGIYSSYALYHINNDETLKAINAAKKTYYFIRQGYPLKERFPELLFSAGIYDFYREQYPETHPGYKSVLWMFAPGGKEKGLNELVAASKVATFTQTEAHIYLVLIYLKYLNEPAKAIPHSEMLAKKYPRNFNFLMKHTEALLLDGNYDEAEKLCHQLKNSGRKLYEMAAYVFYGVIYEKNKAKPETATTYYEYALKLEKEIELPVNEYTGFAYAGLARIAKLNGDYKKMDQYYELALENTQYTAITEEAKTALKH